MATHLVGLDGDHTLCGLERDRLPSADSWLYQSSSSRTDCPDCALALSAPVIVRRETLTICQDGPTHPVPENLSPHDTTIIGGGYLVDAHQERTKQLEARIVELEKHVSLLTAHACGVLSTGTIEYKVVQPLHEALTNTGEIPKCFPKVVTQDSVHHLHPEVITNTPAPEPVVPTAWDRILRAEDLPPNLQHESLEAAEYGPRTRTHGESGS